MELRVEPREQTGKSVNRRLRAEGWIPAVVYGADRDPMSIQVDKATFLEMLRKAGGEHSVFLLKLGKSDKKRHTMIRHIESDPITRRVLHIDFQRVLMDQKVRVEIPVELVGEAIGVKTQDGVLDFITREVTIECLPGDIPPHIDFDVSSLEIGDHAELGDLQLPPGVELMSEPERVLAAVTHRQVLEEPEEDEDDLLLEAEADEPEVIGRGGDDEEDEDDEEDAG